MYNIKYWNYKTKKYRYITTLKKNDMLPSIIFNKDPLICLDMMKVLMENMEKREIDEYPYHYTNLEYKQKLYLCVLTWK